MDSAPRNRIVLQETRRAGRGIHGARHMASGAPFFRDGEIHAISALDSGQASVNRWYDLPRLQFRDRFLA